jgi:thiol:disulfide interchange protein DsbC
VFVDPNCGYCKRFERDLLTVKDVTIYTFLIPHPGADSNAKSRDIWCAKDAAKAWRAWMVDGTRPPKAGRLRHRGAGPQPGEFGRKHRINGTPALFFEDGTRKPGAVSAAEVERLLAAPPRRADAQRAAPAAATIERWLQRFPQCSARRPGRAQFAAGPSAWATPA